MSDKEINRLLAEADRVAQEAARTWLSKQLPQLDRMVYAILDDRVETIVSKLLGFDCEYGREWAIDHCNVRSGESAAGDWLRERAGEAVRQWLDEQARDLPKLPKSSVASLRREYLETLSRELLTAVKRRATEDAAERLNDIVTFSQSLESGNE